MSDSNRNNRRHSQNLVHRTFGAGGVPNPVDSLPLADVTRRRLRERRVPAALDVVARHLLAAREPLLKVLDTLLNEVISHLHNKSLFVDETWIK